MLDKLGAFVVAKRKAILLVSLALTLICAVLIFFVEINKDMTKYLNPSSSMRLGIDIMAEEFPEMATESTIRVMFDELTPAQIDDVFARIDKIPHVSDIAYEKDDPAYNTDGHMLLVLTVPYQYKTPEELSVEQALDEGAFGLSAYTYAWHNDDTAPPGLALKVIIVAVLLILLVLFIMCPSWMEPILFLIVIGIAVIINLGTNIILGSISDTTFQIGAILQLALSMDYSVILMSRYRQEKAAQPDREAAMRAAFKGAFSSVAASSLTTVVGLLMLCFMSYRIGVDLGVVLAKGVFISMVAVLMVLPGLILMAEKWIQRSAKPALHVKMDWAAKYSHAVRIPATLALAALFVVSYILQARTGISYTLAKDDAVAEFFPADNQMVLVYENADEGQVLGFAEMLEGVEEVKSVTGYSTVLAKPYTAGQLYRQIGDMGEGMTLSEGVVQMLFYGYFAGTDTQPMTASEFLLFLRDALICDEVFAASVDADVAENIDMLAKFGRVDRLTTPLTAAELAEFLGIDEEQVSGLMVLYFTNHPGASMRTMTLPAFVNFVLYEVATDPEYGSLFDSGSLAQLRRLENFTNRTSVTRGRSYTDTAGVLGISPDMVKLVYAAMKAEDGSYDPGAVTLGQVLSFVENDLLNTGLLSQFLDAEQVDAIRAVVEGSQLPDLDALRDATQMAETLGIPTEVVEDLYARQFGDDAATSAMSIRELLGIAADEGINALEDSPLAPLLADDALARIEHARDVLATSDSATAFTAAQLANTLGLDLQTARLLVCMVAADRDGGNWSFSLQQVVSFLAGNDTFAAAMDSNQRAQLQMLDTIIRDSLAGTPYTADKLANLLGMNRAQARQLFLLYTLRHGDTSSWKVSVHDFLDFLAGEVLANPTYASMVDESQADTLRAARNLVDAVVAGDLLSADEMAGLLGGLAGAGMPGAEGADMPAFDANLIHVLYLYKEAGERSDPTWRMSLEQLFTYLTESVAVNPRFSVLLDEEAKAALEDGRAQLIAGKAQLVTGEHSRLIITSSFPEESPETMAFIDDMETYLARHFAGDTHLVGSSIMVHEMKQVFSREFLMISLLTALAIFLIVALTFRNLLVPVVLVVLVQTGVNITTAIIGWMSGGMYYLALLIVECILMGSTIDYGILFTSCYRESRQTMGVREALRESYAHATHTILTSGLILVVVVGFLQFMFEEPAIVSIVQTLSVGALCVTLMILFILPGVLAFADRLVAGKGRFVEEAPALPEGGDSVPVALATDEAPAADEAPALPEGSEEVTDVSEAFPEA